MAQAVKTFELDDGSIARVIEDKYNPLIKRRELLLEIDHKLKSTPMRINLRLKVSEVYGVEIQRVYVKKIMTEYGRGVSKVRVNIYDTVERAKQIEPQYVIDRNGGINPFEEG